MLSTVLMPGNPDRKVLEDLVSSNGMLTGLLGGHLFAVSLHCGKGKKNYQVYYL